LFFEWQDLTMRQLAVTKSMHGYSSSIGNGLGNGIGGMGLGSGAPAASPLPSPSAARGGGNASFFEEPSMLSQSFHQAVPSMLDFSHAGAGGGGNGGGGGVASSLPADLFARSGSYSGALGHAATAQSLAYDSTHISAALAALSSHADHMRGFMVDEKILSPRSR
jgi:hypothetical protein